MKDTGDFEHVAVVIATWHFEVPIGAPKPRPAVLDDPMALGVADDHHRMVGRPRAAAFALARVRVPDRLECVGVGIDAHNGRAIVED